MIACYSDAYYYASAIGIPLGIVALAGAYALIRFARARWAASAVFAEDRR